MIKLIATLSRGLILLVLMLVIAGSGCGKKKQHIRGNPNGLASLIDGNSRIIQNHPVHPDQTLAKIRELQKGQSPFAVVITCSDSRVTPELVFDHGLGDLFVIRNAGNIIGDYEMGSVEYAVEHLHTPLVVVLGHTSCGAIGAYIEHKNDNFQNHIQSIVDYLKSEPEMALLKENSPDYYENAVTANVMHGVHILRQSQPVLAHLVESNQVRIIGAVFDIETGRVNILKE